MNRDTFFDNVINDLNEAIKSVGIKRAELARRLGVTNQSVTLTLNRHHNPTVGRLFDMAEAAGLEMHISFTRKEET